MADEREDQTSAQSHPSADAGTHIPRSPQAPSAGGWTPGPWSRVPQTQGGDLIAREYETGNQMNPKGLRLVAFMMARGSSIAEDQANARLIASAPRLAEALQRISAATPNSTNSATIAEFQSWVGAVADAALASAHGEA